MKFEIDVPVTRQKRAKEGYYALINGRRIWLKNRAAAIGAIQSLLDLQRFQVVTVRQLAKRSKAPTA